MHRKTLVVFTEAEVRQHGTDIMTGLSFGMDMTALVDEAEIDPTTFVRGFVERFARDIDNRLKRLRQGQ